jgi:hypothetical protein
MLFTMHDMAAIENSMLGASPILIAVSALIVYFASVAAFRLFFHPLAKFPGPKLAAVTLYYEAYYDVVCYGQYTFKIKELHQKYGAPRINS